MLTRKQEEQTSLELKENLAKSGVEINQIALDLGTSEFYINELLELRPRKIEDTWILRNYLIKKVQEAGKDVTPFTVLYADYHDIWFLDANYIDKGLIK